MARPARCNGSFDGMLIQNGLPAENILAIPAQIRYTTTGEQSRPAPNRNAVEPMLPAGFSQLHSQSRRITPIQPSGRPKTAGRANNSTTPGPTKLHPQLQVTRRHRGGTSTRG
jgi:hypothetical protein